MVIMLDDKINSRRSGSGDRATLGSVGDAFKNLFQTWLAQVSIFFIFKHLFFSNTRNANANSNAQV
jgi:hypothetical protein